MIKPLNNYVLLEIETEEEKTSGGLYVPQGTTTGVEILKKGKVIDISKKIADDESVDLNIDNFVFYNKHAITKVPDHKELVLVRVEDLYGIVD